MNAADGEFYGLVSNQDIVGLRPVVVIAHALSDQDRGLRVERD